MNLKIFRTQSALEFSTWPAKRKALLEIAPAFPNNPKGQPAPGSKLYDYSKKIKISFNANDILAFAFALYKHAAGESYDYKKYADMSKVANSADNDKKSLSVNLNANGGLGIFLSKGAGADVEKLNIILDKSDAYVIAKWLEVTYLSFYMNSTEGDTIDDTHGED